MENELIELQMTIEEDGLGYALENGLIDIENISDPTLAEKLTNLKEDMASTKTYIDNLVEQLTDGDDCIYCD